MKELNDGAYKIPDTQDAILGAGNFGKVYKGFDRQNRPVAIKQISKSKLEEHPYIMEAFQSEVETQKKATSSGMPYFVKLLDHFSTEDDEYIVLEFCQDGTLTDYYKKNQLTIQQILEIIYQVGIGIEYLHRIGITHRDMKLDNVLKMGTQYKIADFGFATEKSVLATCLGTGYYMSPELVKEEEYDRRVDVWAVNTMLYKMLTKKYYFDGRTRTQLDSNIRTQKFRISSKYKTWPSLLQDLLKRGYTKDFRQRPTMLEYIDHPAFNSCKPQHQDNVNLVSNMKFKVTQKSINQRVSISRANQEKLLNRQVYAQVDQKLVHYINSLKRYFDFYLRVVGHDVVLGLVSLKRFMQHLCLLNIFYHNKEYKQTGAFRMSGITNEQWSVFYSFKESKRFVIRIYYHLFIAIRDYKNKWVELDRYSRSKNTFNPLDLKISQNIKNGFVSALQKFNVAMAAKTDPRMLQLRKISESILDVESNPNLMFRSS